MKNLSKKFLALAAAVLLLTSFSGARANIPYLSGPLPASDIISGFNSLITQINQQLSLVNGGTLFSNSYASNPLVLANVQTVTLASANTAGGFTFLNGIAGRTIYPTGLNVTALGGNAATGTGLVIECTSGNVLASYAIAQLASGVPASAFSASVTPGVGFTGCASGDGVLVSHTGSNLATSTGFVINMPYTVQ